MRANERAGLCFLTISCPEPGARGRRRAPRFFVRRHPRGAAEPPRFRFFGSCAAYRNQGRRDATLQTAILRPLLLARELEGLLRVLRLGPNKRPEGGLAATELRRLGCAKNEASARNRLP
jgi:hypothetical protein